jgi:phosphate transport system permease protein
MKSSTKPKTKSSGIDRVYKGLTALLSGSAFLFLFLILIVLIIYSYPSFVINGAHFFTSSQWNPALNNNETVTSGITHFIGASYGMVPFFVGTLITSFLALLIGVPISIGIATFLSQIAPKRIASGASFLVELLAGIPSIIYGLWGFIVLGPVLLRYIEPVMAKYLGFLPGFAGPTYSSGLLASGLILSLMIVPIVASISRDAMAQTPNELKEGGKALGLTNWEITWKIVLPYAKTGIVGGIILGLGRALGETMAVAMVSGGASGIPHSLYYPINSIAAFLALNFDGAFTDPTKMFVYALGELALILLAITMIVNIGARLLVRRGAVSSTDTKVVIGV